MRSAAAHCASVRCDDRRADPAPGAARAVARPPRAPRRRSGCRGRRPAGSACRAMPLERRRRQLLGDDDVVLARGGARAPRRRPSPPRAAAGRRRRARRRRGERDVARGRQRARELGGADRRAGHARPDRLGRHDEHRGPHGRSVSSVRRSMPPSAASAAPYTAAPSGTSSAERAARAAGQHAPPWPRRRPARRHSRRSRGVRPSSPAHQQPATREQQRLAAERDRGCGVDAVGRRRARR